MARNKKVIRIVIKHDLAKDSREMSRNVFKEVNVRGEAHIDKSKYNRKAAPPEPAPLGSQNLR